jgi:hypothetical protein
MKRLSKVLIGIGVFLLAQAMSMGLAESTQTVVTGTNDPANDVKAVQDAVDKGGEILLKGTFHFGDKGSGIIKRDVKILGEKSSEGIPATKIRGGFRTLLSPLPVQLPPETPGPRISIQNIHFDESNMSPIFIAYSSGANISGNKITNVRPLAASPQMNFSVGVIVGTNMIQPAATRKYQPGAVTGSITIADNDLDMSNDTPQKTLGQGIFVHWTTGITLQILALQRYLKLFDNLTHAPFSVRQVCPVVSSLYPGDLRDQCFQRMPLHWQNDLEQHPKLRQSNGWCFFSPT